MIGNARAQAGILLQKFLHPIRVPGEDHHHVVPVILHLLHDGVDGLIPIRATAAIHQRVGFVDKQHTALRLLEPFLHGLRCPAYIFAHQVAPPHFHQMSPGQQPVFPHDPGKEPGHGGFGRAGIAGEHHVHGRAIDFHTFVRKKLLRLVVVQRLQNDLLGLGQADHFHQLLVGVAIRFGFLHLGFYSGNLFVLGIHGGFQLVVIPTIEDCPQFRRQIPPVSLQLSKQLFICADMIVPGQQLQVISGLFTLEKFFL